MTLNTDLVRTRCNEIEESVERLERIAETPLQAFLADQDLRDIACYRLLLAIEAALALCYHVSARRLTQTPDDYAACFAILEKGGLLPADLSARLQDMARFQNLLVHMYWRLDYRRVYQILQKNLGDLRSFCEVVSSLL